MTCITFLISNPRPLTAVEIMIGASPLRKARLRTVSMATRYRRGVDLHGILSLELCSVGVDRGGWKTLVEQEVVDDVYALLGATEDQGSCRWRGDQQVI